jgi:hypothetical protein
VITERTVLILGAGASVDYGFPLGRDLITTICHDLAWPGHSSLWKLLANCDCKPDDITRFQQHLKNSNLPSIDAFLENRKEFERIGKLSIAAVLIPFEKKESFDRSLGPLRRGRQLQAPLRWYEYLHGKLIGRKDDFFSNKLIVVTFNYDRSFEYALFLAIKYAYGLSDQECKRYIKAIPIIHVYGQLGIPYWLSKEGRPYKPEVTPQQAIECIRTIKVLHEESPDTPELREAQKAIREAQVVCCLGFGYHPENITRLDLIHTLAGKRKQLYLSAFGLTEMQKEKIRRRILPTRMPSRCTVSFGRQNQDVLKFLRATAALE